MRRETPLRWVEVMEAKRLHSIRDLAAALGISPQTAARLVHGQQSSRETIEAAAELLDITPERVRELRGETPLQPFRLPPEADQLSHRQRAAIVAVVRAMLEPDDATAIADEQAQVTADLTVVADADPAAQPVRRRSPTGK